MDRGFDSYPYLAPNLFSACILIIDLITIMIFMEESLEEARDLPPLGRRVTSLFAWVWQFTSSSRPSYLRRRGKLDEPEEDEYDEDEGSDASSEASGPSIPALIPDTTGALDSKYIFNRNTILLLTTYLIFQLSNISYNSLYPIFAQEEPPTGRNLSPEEIGLSLAFAGLVTIAFQIGVFGKLREKLGNKVTYRVGLFGFVLAFIMMPFVGYKEADDGEAIGIGAGKLWLWAELGFVLLVKTVATVGGLTSALLLVILCLLGTSSLTYIWLTSSDHQFGA